MSSLLGSLPEGCAYRIGVDVGDRSVGVAAVAYTGDEPVGILEMTSYLHDGGSDPTSGKKPASRKAVSGLARRIRRGRYHRRQRLAALDALLREADFPVPATSPAETYEVWAARDEASRGFIADPGRRAEAVASAVRHIARHRGWRNPWASYERLLETARSGPTDPMVVMMAKAQERWPGCVAVTIGQIGHLASASTVPLRPRTRDQRKNGRGAALAKTETRTWVPVDSNGEIRLDKNKQEVVELLGAALEKVRAEDNLAELDLILRTQQVEPALSDRICRAVFTVRKPHVPQERVGRDALPGQHHLYRAVKADLAFQEFRIRDLVANLRVKDARGKHPLTPAAYRVVVEHLMTATDRVPWAKVAELAAVKPRNLIRPGVQDGAGAAAPFDSTSTRLLALGKEKIPALGAWWGAADRDDRAALVTFLADAAASASDGGQVSDLLATMDDEALLALEGLKLETDRAAYSRESLVRLNAYMSEHCCDHYTARRALFGVTEDEGIARQSLDDPVADPTVQRVNNLVRRFLYSAHQRWGAPERVVVEVAREGVTSPLKNQEANRLQAQRTTANIALDEQAGITGSGQARRVQRRKTKAINLQQGACFYCNAGITPDTCEMDHVVASSRGGSNRAPNLAAACRACNADKGNQAFVHWVKTTTRPVTMAEVKARLGTWVFPAGVPARAKAAHLAEVRRRLVLEPEDDLDDDRSINATAYAATVMRERIDTWLRSVHAEPNLPPEPGLEDASDDDRRNARSRVQVYRGGVTDQARRASGYSKIIMLRGLPRKTRLDRRHHALDAAILTTLRPGAAQVLADRKRLFWGRDLDPQSPDPHTAEQRTPETSVLFEAWGRNARILAALVKDALDCDAVGVVRPVRVSRSVGRVHEETVRPLIVRDLRDGLSAEDLLRVANPGDYLLLAARADATGSLPPDSSAWLPGRRTAVEVFPGSAGCLKVRGGYVEVGTTHHGRIYRWTNRAGLPQYGLVAVYATDFVSLKWGREVDVLTHPLAPQSISLRCASKTVRAKILSGEARQIAWVTQGTPVTLDPNQWLEDKGKLPDLLRDSPETRWEVRGVFANGQMSIAPLTLASEGFEDASETVRTLLSKGVVAVTPSGLLSKGSRIG